jgi:hypothetical protein
MTFNDDRPGKKIRTLADLKWLQERSPGVRPPAMRSRLEPGLQPLFLTKGQAAMLLATRDTKPPAS